MSSSFGQRSLMLLPSESQSSASVASYAKPKQLQGKSRKALSGSKAGIDVYKVAKNGKLQPRRIALSYDNRCILVTSNKIKSIRGLFKALTPDGGSTARSIDISSVERIEQGHQTNRFIAAKTMEKLPVRDDNASVGPADNDEANCLSIVYRVSTRDAASFTEGLVGVPKLRGPHRFDTLDLLVPNNEDYDALLKTLEELLSLYRDERTRYDSFALFCEYQWIDLGKERSSLLSSSEWVTLCENCNVGMKKSAMQAFYREYVEDNSITDEGLTLADTMELLQEIKETIADEEDPLLDLWDMLVDSDPVPPLRIRSQDEDEDMELEVNSQEETISAVAFLSFIRSEQKEFTATLNDVHKLLGTLDGLRSWNLREDENECPTERLNKDAFFAYLTSAVNDIFDPAAGKVNADEMDHPLSRYWINTSHDTYLAKLPNSFHFKDMDYEGYHAIDVQGYANALYRGVRCLELDVYDALLHNYHPVVARRKATSPNDNQTIPFSHVIKAVRAFLRKHKSSFPIILYLETHCSVENQVSMANDLNEILGSEGMLYTPSKDVLNNGSPELPSPNELRGKVVIKNKRPKTIREGATVLNDDLDEDQGFRLEEDGDKDRDDNLGDNDDDFEDEEDRGVVVRFESAGPIRTTDPSAVRHSPKVLLEVARKERLQAKEEAARSFAKEFELKEDAKSAETHALALIGAAGLTVDEVQSNATLQNSKSLDENGDNPDVDRDLAGSTSGDTEDGPEGDEGLEVQHFFGSSVEDARSEHSEADSRASVAAEVAAHALLGLNQAEEALVDAENKLEESYQRQKDLTIDAKKQANLARANREHADTARRRVDTVKELLRNSRDNAASAETVVVTAMTESKISEQRASETESRASRALNIADKERQRAEAETAREEMLEQEAASYHDRVMIIAREAKTARDRMDKSNSMLDRVNEQIKLIEKSSQYQKEKKAFVMNPHEANGELTDAPRHGGNFLAKHAAKLQERLLCAEQIKEASIANQESEAKRKRVQSAFEESAHMWKMQVEIASQARKQADRSSQHAEELAEHAEEEREAASLRHIAREKAQSSVSRTDSNSSSIQAQLIEASRASEEAASLALESRLHAEKVAREAEHAKDHTAPIDHVTKMRARKEAAKAAHAGSLAKKGFADSKAADAKRLLDTSSEVFTKAKRDAAAEVNNANAKRQIEHEAVQAYRKHLIAKKLVESATLQSKVTKETAIEKSAAESRAEEYKFKMDRRAPVASDLANLTLLHSTKFKGWEKGDTLPNAHMHSIAQVRIAQMLEEDTKSQHEKFAKFTKDHLVRSFPAWGLVSEEKETNYDPVAVQALGCQLVSMNFHTSNEHLLLNDGRFRTNGSCGYVLKPEIVVSEPPSEKWKLTVLAGMCLPKGEAAMARKTIGANHCISPFVQVSVYEGRIGDDQCKIHTTEPANNGGLNPVWDEQSHFEVEIENPAIAVILFSVWDDETSDFVAGAAFPANSMRQGYRSVALFDSLHSRSGPYAYASLVVRAQKV